MQYRPMSASKIFGWWWRTCALKTGSRPRPRSDILYLFTSSHCENSGDLGTLVLLLPVSSISNASYTYALRLELFISYTLVLAGVSDAILCSISAVCEFH